MWTLFHTRIDSSGCLLSVLLDRISFVLCFCSYKNRRFVALYDLNSFPPLNSLRLVSLSFSSLRLCAAAVAAAVHEISKHRQGSLNTNPRTQARSFAHRHLKAKRRSGRSNGQLGSELGGGFR